MENLLNLGQLDSRYAPNFNGDQANLGNVSNLNVTNYPVGTSTTPTSAPAGSAGAIFQFQDVVNGGFVSMFVTTPGVNGNFLNLSTSFNEAGTTGNLPSLGFIQNGVMTDYYLKFPNSVFSYTVEDLQMHMAPVFGLDTSQKGADNLGFYMADATASPTANFVGFANGYNVSSSSNTTTTPAQNAEVFTSDGFLSSILFVSVGQFTSAIERLADARAENGAEQAGLTCQMSCLFITRPTWNQRMDASWMRMWP